MQTVVRHFPSVLNLRECVDHDGRHTDQDRQYMQAFNAGNVRYITVAYCIVRIIAVKIVSLFVILMSAPLNMSMPASVTTKAGTPKFATRDP